MFYSVWGVKSLKKLMALIIDIWFGGKTAMATNLIIVNSKIIHLATPIDASDALSKSYVDTPTNNLLKTD